MSARPHILFVTEFFHPDICASAVVASDHLRRLAMLRPDLRFTVITSDRAWHDSSIVYPPRDEVAGVAVIRVPRPRLMRRSLLRRTWGFAMFQRNALSAARKQGRVDLVIGTTAPPQGGQLARRIAARNGCPYVYKVYDLYPDLAATLGRIRRGGLLHRRWLYGDLRNMRDAAAVVPIGARTAERIVNTRELPAKSVRCIHDGFDVERLHLPGGESSFARQHNPDGRFCVQYAGNMGLSHPFDTILDAARRLAEHDVLFQFIGDGPHRGAIADCGLANVQLIEYQPAERLGEVLAAADVALISQHAEMFDKALPYKVYATLAAGRPAVFVGNRRSEIAEWLQSSGAGKQIDHGNAEELAETLLAWKADAAQREAMGRAARSFFESRFTVDRAVESWSTLIDDVLRQRR